MCRESDKLRCTAQPRNNQHAWNNTNNAGELVIMHQVRRCNRCGTEHGVLRGTHWTDAPRVSIPASSKSTDVQTVMPLHRRMQHMCRYTYYAHRMGTPLCASRIARGSGQDAACAHEGSTESRESPIPSSPHTRSKCTRHAIVLCRIPCTRRVHVRGSATRSCSLMWLASGARCCTTPTAACVFYVPTVAARRTLRTAIEAILERR